MMDTVYQIVWLVLLVVFAIAEAATVGLTSVWFALGSLGALICALAGGSIWLQVGIFIVLSLVCLLALRPLAKKYLNSRVEATNADRVIGQEARVPAPSPSAVSPGPPAVSTTPPSPPGSWYGCCA